MQNLSFQTVRIDEAFTNVNSVAKTSRVTNKELKIKELVLSRVEGSKDNDGNFYSGSIGEENFRIFHRFSTNNLELDKYPSNPRSKEIIVKKFTLKPF